MTTPLLTLPAYIGQRSATFKFVLQDGVTGIYKGEINPIRDSPPALSHDSNRTIKRSVTLTLGKEDTSRVNVIRDRVYISMILGGVEYPLGKYMFSNQTRARWTSGLLSSVTLLDEMFIIDQDMEQGYNAINKVDVDIQGLLGPVSHLFDMDLEGSQFFSSGAWASGASRAKALTDLALQGGYFSPWFDNNGVLRFVRSFDPADKIEDFDFDEQNSVFRENIAESDELLSAPNRIIVVSNSAAGGASQAPVVGTYNIPASAPHSIMNRGFVIPDVLTMQLSSSDQAAAMARTIGISQTVFERVELTTAPDPRHDGYNVIKWQGELWLELAWTMVLAEGGAMRHVLRKVYS